MAYLTGLPRTLLLTLRARAEESTLFIDDKAQQWATQLPWDDDLSDFLTPGYKAGFAVRTRIFDDVTRRFIAEHDEPLIVELGAGLSTRCYRIGLERADWIEVDLPEAIAVRRMVDGESVRHRFIAASLLEGDWLTSIPSDKDILFIAEGVLLFIEQTEVKRLFQRLGERFPGASILFDAVGSGFHQRAADRFTAIDAPIRWVQDVAQLDTLNLTVDTVWYTLDHYPKRWGKHRPTPLTPAIKQNSYLVEGHFP